MAKQLQSLAELLAITTAKRCKTEANAREAQSDARGG